MIAFRKRPDEESSLAYHEFCIQLKVSPAEREDAWDICGTMQRLGGVEVRDCCFAFATEQRRQMALESLRRQFGPRYFEALDADVCES
jgi:hypothetical protein